MRRMVFVLGVFGLLCSRCGPAGLDLPAELAGQQPFLVKVEPEPDRAIGPTEMIALSFSQTLAAATVNDSSIVAYAVTDDDIDTETIQDRWKDELRGDVAIALMVAEDAQMVQIAPRDGFPPGRLALVVTPALSSLAGFPFSQAPGVSNRPYVMWFRVVDPLSVAEFNAGDAGVTVSGAGGMATGNAQPTVSTAPPQSGTPPVTAPPPLELVINEILYDVPGDDTNGVLFIELRGTPGAGIGKYVVRCMNGDGGKVTDTIVLPAAAVIPDDGIYVIADGITGNLTATTVVNADVVANFDPQNGPDAVQLLAADGTVQDVIGYGTPLPLYDADGLPLYEGVPAAKASAGQSLSRTADGADTDSNAADFSASATPSPGL